MKKIVGFVIALSFCVSLNARDEFVNFSLDFLKSQKAQEVLDPSIKISFGSGTKASIIKKGLVSNKKTNAVGKSDQEACEWALLSALKSFQDRARKEGGTKVVNLVSYYKKNVFDSKSKFQCGAGNIMAGVALKGDIAK